MSNKIPQYNYKQQLKSVFKSSLLFFAFVSVLAISYQSFKENVDPFLNKYLPGSVEFLSMDSNNIGTKELKK